MRRFLIVAAAGLLATTGAAAAQPSVDRMYAIDCGTLSAPNKSLWTPGKNVGTPVVLSENCYLIKHPKGGYLLWDTGIADALTGKPFTTHGMTLERRTSLEAQFKQIGVAPSEVTLVGLSHTHPDHTGNLGMFAGATLLLQKKEYDWSPGAGFLKFAPDRPVKLLDGDYDVFGDGSVKILSTPGHTPGHQSLLVHLRKTGWVVLSGDVAHLQENYDNDVAPALNVDPVQTVASIERVKGIVKQLHAKLWINHDLAQSQTVAKAPKFFQ